MEPHGDASLRGRVRAIAQRYGLRPQEVLQMYLFEHLLLRLSESDYSDKFILKGGLLVAAVAGIAQRTTLDMDASITGMDTTEQMVTMAITSICEQPIDDDMTYSFERIEPIHEGWEYASWRAHIRVRFGRIDAPIKLDITTGDIITPHQLEWEYPRMFDEGTIRVQAYPLVTVLAEKFETVVRRGISNTRARDFYDIYVLMNSVGNAAELPHLRRAVRKTAEARGSDQLVARYRERIEEVLSSPLMHEVWERYTAASPYARGVTFESAVDAILKLGSLAVDG